MEIESGYLAFHKDDSASVLLHPVADYRLTSRRQKASKCRNRDLFNSVSI